MLRVLALLALLGGEVVGAESAQRVVSDSATVAVAVQVAAFAEIQMPQGNELVLNVPVPWCPAVPPHHLPAKKHNALVKAACSLMARHWLELSPVRLPFTVSGNARVQVSVTPDRFLRVAGGRYLGAALSWNGKALGYHAVVQFPLARQDYHWIHDWLDTPSWWRGRDWYGYGPLPGWSGIAHLPGHNGAGTPPLEADLPFRNGRGYGVIYAVSRRDWTSDGRDAPPGNYGGTITITVTSE